MGNRGDITNEQWERLQELLPESKTTRGHPSQGHQQNLEMLLQGEQAKITHWFVEFNLQIHIAGGSGLIMRHRTKQG